MTTRNHQDDAADALVAGLLELEMGKRKLPALPDLENAAAHSQRPRAMGWLSAAGILLALAALATVMLYSPDDGNDAPLTSDADSKTAQAGDNEGDKNAKQSGDPESVDGEGRDNEVKDFDSSRVSRLLAKWPRTFTFRSSEELMRVVERATLPLDEMKSVRLEGSNFDAKALKEFAEHFSPDDLVISGAKLTNADLRPLLKMKTPKSLKLERMPDVNDPLIFRWAITGTDGRAVTEDMIVKLKQAKEWCSKLQKLDYQPATPADDYFSGWASDRLVSEYFGSNLEIRLPIQTFSRLVGIATGSERKPSAFGNIRHLTLYSSSQEGLSDEHFQELADRIAKIIPGFGEDSPAKPLVRGLTLEVNGGPLSDKGMEYLIRGSILEKDLLQSLSLSQAEHPTMASLRWLTQRTFPRLQDLYFSSIPQLEAPPRLWAERHGIDGKNLPELAPSTLKRLTMRYCFGLDDDGLVGIESTHPELEQLNLDGTQGPTGWTEMPDWENTPHVTDAFCRKLKKKLPKCEIIGPHGLPIETQFLRVAFKTNGRPELNKRPDHLFLVRKSDQVVMPLEKWTNHIGVSIEDFFYQEQNAPKVRTSLPAIHPFFTDSDYLAAGEYELISRHPGKSIPNIPVTIKEGERTEVIFDWGIAKDAESPLANPTLGLEVTVGLKPNPEGEWPDITWPQAAALITTPESGALIATPQELGPEGRKAPPLFMQRWSIALNAALKEVQVEIYAPGLPVHLVTVDFTRHKLIAINWNGEEWHSVRGG